MTKVPHQLDLFSDGAAAVLRDAGVDGRDAFAQLCESHGLWSASDHPDVEKIKSAVGEVYHARCKHHAAFS